jgi:hypothetical protein
VWRAAPSTRAACPPAATRLNIPAPWSGHSHQGGTGEIGGVGLGANAYRAGYSIHDWPGQTPHLCGGRGGGGVGVGADSPALFMLLNGQAGLLEHDEIDVIGQAEFVAGAEGLEIGDLPTERRSSG